MLWASRTAPAAPGLAWSSHGGPREMFRLPLPGRRPRVIAYGNERLAGPLPLWTPRSGAAGRSFCRVARAATQFDRESFLQREEFDLLSFQSVRREALLQYRNTNQSEPLRIGLFLLGALGGLFAPFLAPKDAEATFYGAALLAVLVFGFLFNRERGKRTAQLVRLQREYSIGDLWLEDEDLRTGASSRVRVREFRSQRRLVLLNGSELQLREALTAGVPYRQRLRQSEVIVVPVSAGDGEGETERAVEAALGGRAAVRASSMWLRSPGKLWQWQDYFEDLLEDRGGPGGRSVWVALNFRGRVIGSSFGAPIWDEVLAALPPRRPLLSTDPTAEGAGPPEVLAAQDTFYKALLAGDEATISQLFVPEDDPELSFAIQTDASGSTNLSGWPVVLAEGARPELIIASRDAVLQNSYEAVTTCIEFPMFGPTLLATQVWRRAPSASPGEPCSEWKLLNHRTIPYANQVEARVALRCDHRGCVAFGKQMDAMR